MDAEADADCGAEAEDGVCGRMMGTRVVKVVLMNPQRTLHVQVSKGVPI